MKKTPPPAKTDRPKPEAVQRGGRPLEPMPPPRQKGGSTDKGAAAAQVPHDDATLAPESGDKLGGGPGGR
jgi:hypothetical protein